MKPKDFFLFVEAYSERVKKDHEIARRIAYFTVAPHIGKGITMKQFFAKYWPLPDAEDEKRKQRLRDKIKKVNEHGQRRAANTDRG